MNRKILTRLLSVLLAVVMTFGLLPVGASAAWWNWRDTAETQPAADTQAATDNSDFIRVFHLDCGRKYFTVAEVEKIIDQLAANYYTHLELAFGNEGLRFIPDADKMAVGSYTGEQVVAALAKGNQSYDGKQRLSYTTDAWSETEMTEIISYANGKGIEIIPMFDIPGHMNAVIAAMQELGISVSVFSQVGYTYPGNIGQSFDPTNAAAAAFAKGLVENYIAYFKDKCKYFNIAGDECGFSKMDNTQYTAYVDLMNALNTTVKANGMTTMMFNDGVYYKDKNATNPLSTDIVICYWTGGDNYATSPELAKKGFTLLNTNTHWYYVAGKEYGNAQFYYDYALNAMKTKKCNVCDGGGQTTDFGCMLAFWCDDPTKSVSTSNLNTYIKTLAESNPDYFKATKTPETEELAITSSSTTDVLKMGESLTLTANIAATWSTADAEVVDLTSDANGLSTVVTARSAGTATIKATARSDASKTALYTVTVTSSDESDVKETVTIEMTVGDTSVTKTQDGVNTASTSADADIAAVKVAAEPAMDDFKPATSITSGNSYYIYDGNDNFLTLSGNSLTNTTDQSEATRWTINRSGNSYTIKSGSYYLQYSDNLTVTKRSGSATSWGYSSTKGFTYSYYSIAYNNGWGVSYNNSNYGMAYTGETKPASTSITFTPVAEGTTEIIVGTTKYVINVKAKTQALAKSMNPNDTIDLKTDIEENGSVEYEMLTGNEYVTLDGSKVTSGESDGTARIRATVTSSVGRTMAVYTFTIRISEEDVTGVSPLPIQLWITNQSIEANNASGTSGKFSSGGESWKTGKAFYIPVAASLMSSDGGAVNSNDGLPLSACVPDVIENRYQYATAYRKTSIGTAEENQVPYNFKVWKGTVLTKSGSGLQGEGEASMVHAGSDFQYVRYYNETWAVSSDRKTWTPVTGGGSTTSYSACTEQIVAYYYMRTKLTDEVITDVVDWGNPVSSQSSNYALLDFAVKYEGGTRVPSTFPNDDKTRVMNTTGTVVTDGSYRIVDQIDVTNDTVFEVYMITLTPTSSNFTSTIPSTYAYDYTQEKVTWAKSIEDLPEDYQTSERWYTDQSAGWYVQNDSNKSSVEKNGTLTFNNPEGTNVGGNPKLSFVEIKNMTGMLVTYYIRPVKDKTDTLLVQYVDDMTGNLFYKYDIAVNEGTTFDTEPAIRNNLMEDYLVKGIKNDVTVTCDLTKMDGVPAAYRYANYTFVKVERSDGNKTMTLHYTFKRDLAIIADFGLPVTLKLGDVNSLLERNKERITRVVPKATGGNATVNVDHSVTFTPNAVFDTGAVLTITYAGKNITDNNENSITYSIAIIPASNVLYEENFLKQGTAEEISGMQNSNIQWKQSASTGLTSQTAQLTTDEEQIYGYDDVYKGAGSKNGYWEVSGLHDATVQWDESAPLETTFTGNGFDLIGSCGPKTGRVLVAIKNKDGKMVKAALVDTYYSQGDIHQVPLAHLMLDGGDEKYTVQLFAYGALKPHETANTQSAISTFAAPAMTADPVTAKLRELGISWSDVEVISVADTFEAQTANAVAVQSAALAVEANETEDTTYSVTIDGFRVYRSTNNDAYSAAEKDVTYKNILDVVKGQITAFADESDESTFAVEDYEAKGGPQNEIYLLPNVEGDKLVQFQLVDKAGNAYENKTVQISFRKVDDTDENGINCVAKYNDTAVSSIVEMYYNVTTDDNGIVTIMNTATDTDGSLTLLAIGNVKLPEGVTAIAPQDTDKQLLIQAARAAIAPEHVKETFTPDTFKANATSLRLFRNKVVTLNISVSKDVSYVTVNGKTYTPSKFFSRWMKNATILVTDTIGRNETKTYTIIAYNSDGVASDPIEVKG